MSKPLLHVVKTNYDWNDYWTTKPLPEVSMRLQGTQPDIVRDSVAGRWVLREISGRSEFREIGLRAMPSVELRRKYVNRHLKDGLEVIRLVEGIGFDDLVHLILFDDAHLRGYVMGELPSDFTHFPLVVDFYSNFGLYDAPLKSLEEAFDVHRLTINRLESHSSFS